MTIAIRLVSVFAALVCGIFALGTQCAAQGFPSMPIRFVVSYPPGGAPDAVMRLIGQRLGESVGWRVVVDNRPGASGFIAAGTVAKAPADGHTLLVADTSLLAINPSLFPNLPYDPLRDFAPVTHMVSIALFLSVNAALPVQTVRQLIEYAKSKPGIPYASSGNGSAAHIGLELFKLLTGANMTHIPYKGVAQAVPALISGDVSVAMVAGPSILPHARSGKARLLAVATGRRTPSMPELPTISEAGVPGYENRSDLGIVGPAGTPMSTIAELNREIVKVLAMPDIAQRLLALGFDPVGSSPEQYDELTRAEIRKYTTLLKEIGVRID